MLTNKDIRVENGNLVLNGDKFPLDGQSPEAIMAIVEDNSDTTPTENSTAPITSGGVFTADKAISDTIGDITQTGITGDSVAEQLKILIEDLTTVNHAVVSSHANVTASSVFCYSVGNIVVVSGWLKVNTAIPTPASNTTLVTFADTMPIVTDNHRAFFASVNSTDNTTRSMKVYQRSIMLDSTDLPAGNYTINAVCIV